MSPPTVLLRDIYERDMDLLLLEEFVSSTNFCREFLKLIGITDDLSLMSAERSVLTQTGESDIELTFAGNGQKFRLLIENKVDAPLQPRQGVRYLERGKIYCESGVCHEVKAIIVGPAVYLANAESHGFDASVTYEQLLAWFETNGNLGPRCIYKAAVINRAIERGHTGWQLRPNQTTTDFWHRYWKLSEACAPELCMREPAQKPRDPNFIRFRPPLIPTEISLIHQVPYGRVDLQFSAMADKLAKIEKQFGKKLLPGMRIIKAAKSGAIRVRVEEIDMQAPFAESENDIRNALKAAVSLLHLYADTE
jgi:hypothetical protein